MNDDNTELFEVLPWSKKLETGISKIDEQHQVLVGLLNELANTLVIQKHTQIDAAIEALENYAAMHFAEEEVIWNRYFSGDPWLISHQKSHASFLPSIEKLKVENRGDSSREPDSVVNEKLVHFLFQWLAFHIIDSDKRMVVAVKAIDAGATIDEAKNAADKEMVSSREVLVNVILDMYQGLTSRTLELMRERNIRIAAEEKLRQANEDLKALAITDSLTGLYNRRYFDSTFKLEMAKAKRNKTPLSCLLIDVDFFKRLNDQYGHVVGDHALEKLADCLQRVCRRPGDLVFRIGGEEFAVLNSAQNVKDEAVFAEIIRVAVEELKFPNSNSDVSEYMTVSIGVAHKIPAIEDDQDGIMNIADKKLYKAKELGRNRVVWKD